MAEKIDWPMENNVQYACGLTSWWDCAVETFVQQERGDYFGVAQPFGFSDGMRPDNVSPWEVNGPRALVLVDPPMWFWDDYFGRTPIMNSVATWFGVETDTATLNYFYVGMAMGFMRFDSDFVTAANTIVQCGIWNSRRNVHSKKEAFERGFLCQTSDFYNIYCPLFARLIYVMNDEKSQEWLGQMVPNLARTGNYVDEYFNPSVLKQPVLMYPPSFIYLSTDIINSCKSD